MKEQSGKDNTLLSRLLDKGVRIPFPETVEIGPDVDPERISGERVTIHAGCRISGDKALILPGVELGFEAPVTLRNCQVGMEVRLQGGYFFESCFLKGVSMGSGAQVREGCLLEEGSRAGHTVGLKQTVLLPFVTLGSLVNFCDILMAGGTDEKNHSEVGSSYVHFNYTPNQDKAAPSLVGDVPRGVMINQAPIFLGGQGGLVGPVNIGYGTVVAAGTLIRKDLLKEDRLFLGQLSPGGSMPFHRGLYNNIKRIIDLNTLYIANLIALRRWYFDVRFRFAGAGHADKALLEGAVEKLDMAVDERLRRLQEVAGRMPRSISTSESLSLGSSSQVAVSKMREFMDRWPEIENAFREGMSIEGDASQKDALLAGIERGIKEKGNDYTAVIKGLKDSESGAGTAWLQGLVDRVVLEIKALLPSLRRKGQ